MVAAFNQQTEVFKDHGRDLREECRHMNLVLRGKEGFDYIKLSKDVELLHNYINASGYFPDGSKYVHFFRRVQLL